MINTAFLLMARYNAAPVIELETVRRDWFSHLDMKQFVTKLNKGQIALPVVRSDGSSQQTQKGVALAELARYLDDRMHAASKELEQLRPH